MTVTAPKWNPYITGLLLAILIGLLATAHGVFNPEVLKTYSNSPDSVDITQWAERTTSSDIAGWWHGSWIQRTSPYYRPLSSVVFWLEYKAFGWNFQGHVVVSWLIHGMICGIIYLMGLSFLPGTPRQKLLFSLWAVVLFNIRRGPTGPGWIPAPVAYGVVAWWPGQTDQLCLLFSLPAILHFDLWLTTKDKSHLKWAVGCWLVALLFKEMAVCLPLVCAMLALYRRGVKEALPVISAEGKKRLGLAWSILLYGMGFVILFLLMRSVFVPNAWGPEAKTAAFFLKRAIWFIAEAPLANISARGEWVVFLGLFAALLVYVYYRLPKRPSAVWFVLSLLLGLGILAQVFAGNFALVTIPSEIAAIGVITLFILGFIVLLHCRSGIVWALLGMTLMVHLPILHVQGPHYMYWPAAFWSLFHAALLLWLWQQGRLFGVKADKV